MKEGKGEREEKQVRATSEPRFSRVRRRAVRQKSLQIQAEVAAVGPVK